MAKQPFLMCCTQFFGVTNVLLFVIWKLMFRPVLDLFLGGTGLIKTADDADCQSASSVSSAVFIST